MRKLRNRGILHCWLIAIFLFAFVAAEAQLADSVKYEGDSIAAYFRPSSYNILYGKQHAGRLVQSISYLNGKELEKSPVSLMSNAFQGRMAGLNMGQASGAPRYDNPVLSLRGRDPLIVIDGVPRYGLSVANAPLYDVLNINPEQVESITLLKDGLSTAMLGNRGMDGVLMVTTRKRSDEKYNYISAKAQAGFQSPVKLRKMLSASDYATLYNEALANDGYAPLYTQQQIDNYKNGSDKYLYPDVDWYNQLLNKNAMMNRYTVNATGSSRFLNYFVSLDYLKQEGILKEDKIKNQYGTNIDYKRYILRSNIELHIDNHLSAFLNVFGTIHDYVQPGLGYGTVFTSVLNTPNNAYPVLNFNGSYGGNTSYRENIWAQSTGTGYLKNNMQSGSFDVGLKRNMDDVLKGFWVKASLSYNPTYEQQILRTKDFEVFQFPVTGDSTTFRRFGTETQQVNTPDVVARMQQAYSEVSMGYDRLFGKSALNGIVLGNYESLQVDRNLNQVIKGVATRWNYSFDERYNFELAAAYNGNNRFAPGKQYNFYPAAGLSWNIHKESFFNNQFLNQFKLRATYGKVGNANPGYYQYLQNYVSATGYFFGTSATSVGGVRQGDLANPNRVVEKANKLNLGLDLAFSNNRGWFTADYYNNRQYDLLQTRGYNTAILGQVYPLENIGINKYYGLEFAAGWADKIQSFNYFIEGNFSTRQSKNIDIDEEELPFGWMRLTGLPVNQIRGYEATGFFNPSNLNDATIEGYKPVAGDLKYRDLNSDGIININDRTIIGNKKPLLFYGLNLGFKVKGFDVSALLQGVKNRDIVTTGNYEWEFQNNGKGQLNEYHLNRYTAATANTATYPRLTIGTNRNNHQLSSFWVRNGDYLRFKNFEVGYSFGNNFLTKIKIREVRLFVNGQNIFTISKFDEADPEVFGAQYPLMKTINGGISVKL